MRPIAVISALIVFFPLPLFAFQNSDTTKVAFHTATKKVSIRMHSAGVFGYSGRIVSNNPVADVSFTYERKHWGYTFFKAQDSKNRSSDMNFALSGFYTNVKLGKHVTITPYIAFRFEQRNSFVDKGSDAIFIVTTTWKIQQHVVIDHTSLFSNLFLERNDFDWINRLRFLYTTGHLDLGVMMYNNNNVFDHDSYVSEGATISYSRIKVSDHISLSTGLTGIYMSNTSDQEQFPMKNGLIFTVTTSIH